MSKIITKVFDLSAYDGLIVHLPPKKFKHKHVMVTQKLKISRKPRIVTNINKGE